ncbi:hypothetical protein V502_06446 [Pseudogymnoascus sp. VKM F-4520 (FW-2644)]|nr:hypothetical protein V502_06446 [Pseudogymnoascus sp. VKM F-4520 (FW-2644)]
MYNRVSTSVVQRGADVCVGNSRGPYRGPGRPRIRRTSRNSAVYALPISCQGIRVFFLFVFLSTTGFDSPEWGGRSGAGGAGAGEVVVLLEEGLSGGAGLGCVLMVCSENRTPSVELERRIRHTTVVCHPEKRIETDPDFVAAGIRDAERIHIHLFVVSHPPPPKPLPAIDRANSPRIVVLERLPTFPYSSPSPNNAPLPSPAAQPPSHLLIVYLSTPPSPSPAPAPPPPQTAPEHAQPPSRALGASLPLPPPAPESLA